MPTQEDVVEEFRSNQDPVLTAREIADSLGISRRTALRWLDELEDDGTVASKAVGGRAKVWWLNLSE